jgi:hypothetical protein
MHINEYVPKGGFVMANDLFGGLNGLMKGFSNFMPQDDPNVKLMNVQSEINDLQNQEIEIYAEIGKLVINRGTGQFPELEQRLKLVQTNLANTQAKYNQIKAEIEQKEKEKLRAEEQCTCANCGFRNSDGVKFCQECGSKLSTSTQCPKCGAKLVLGVRFCGECGTRLEG